MRLAGCVVGALLGVGAMLCVIPSFTSIAALMAIVFLGALAGAWVVAGSPRISYAGFQVAFAFLLCVVQGPAPAFDLTIARDRVIGIVLGNVVLYLISTHAWPMSVGWRIEAGIAKALRDLSLMMAATNAATRRSLSAQARAALGAVESDLEVARYGRVVRRAARLKTQVDVARHMAALEAPLPMIAEQDTAASADIAAVSPHGGRSKLGRQDRCARTLRRCDAARDRRHAAARARARPARHPTPGGTSPCAALNASPACCCPSR